MGILREHLRDELVMAQVEGTKSQKLIHQMAQVAEQWSGIDAVSLEEIVWKREQGSSTGVGNRVAIPHGRMDALDDVILVVANSKNPIDFSSDDGEGVQLIFMLIVPENNNLLYLKLLAKISMLCSDKETRESLISAKTPREIIDIIEEAD